MKTIKEWLNEMPEPYRSQSINNHEGYKGLGYAGSLSIALILAFKWSSTMEGTKYWEKVNAMCLSGEFKRLVPFKNRTVKLRKGKNVPNEFANVDQAIEFIVKNRKYGNSRT